MTDFPRIERSTPVFWQTTIALFAAGFSTFALMYCIQPLLPELAEAFGVSAATSSLAISLTTGALSVTLLLSGSLTEAFGRKAMMVVSLGATAILTTVAAMAPSWTTFLLLRTAAGVTFAGLPAIAMAYVGEEISPRAAGLAMGLYVSGTAVGGMSGRLVAAALTDTYGWRTAVGSVGVFGLATAILVAAVLPPARHQQLPGTDSPRLLEIYRAHLANPQLLRLFVQGFLVMGGFVAVYNYLTFRLIAPPYGLGHTAVGSVFLVYLVGMVSSPWAGVVAGTRGRRRTLVLSAFFMLAGVMLTMVEPLAGIIAGVALLTFGFFAAQSVTSTWVGLNAGGRRAQASSLYIVFYYVGASVTGTLAGVFWSRFGWPGVAGFVLVQIAAALALLRGMKAN